MKMVLAIAAGGAAGATARHFVTLWLGQALGHGFPWGTLAVNVLGSLALGALVELMALKWSAGPEMRAFLVVGVMGAFTTFSAFSLEVVALAERGQTMTAGAYVAGSVILSVGGFLAGLRLFRLLLA